MADTALKIANDFKKELDQLLETMQNDSNATLNFKTALAIDMIYEQLDLENLVDNFPEITGKIGELQESLIKDQEIARENIRKLENELERLPRNSVDRRIELEGKIEIETAQLNFMEDFSEKLKEHAVKFNNYSYEQEYEQAVPKDPLQEELSKNVQDVMQQNKKPEKAEQEPKQENPEPKDVFHLTREELVNILTMDGTYQEIETAIKNKELTENEKENILSFLQADTQEKAKQAFDKVLNDIKSAPTYENVDDRLAYWTKQREELGLQVEKLQNSMKDYEKRRDELQENIESIKAMKGISPERRELLENLATKDIDEHAKEMAIKTYQYNALDLMHGNAKSMEAQLIAMQHDEVAKKRREAMQQRWDKLSEHTQDMSQSVKNMRKTLSLSKQFNRSDLAERFKEHIPILRQKTNKYLIEDSKQCLKNINEYKKEAKSIEDKIRAKADKISMKEYKREHRFDGVKKLLGREIDESPKNDTRTPIEKLKDGNWFQKLQAKVLEKQLEKQHKYIKDEYARLDKNTQKIRENVLQQRAKLHTIDKQVQDLDKNNAFTKGLAKAELDALQRTQFSAATLGGDLANYYKRQGLNDMMVGSQINLDITRNNDQYTINKAVKELLKEDDIKMVDGKLYDFSEAKQGKDGKFYGAKEIKDPVDFRDKLRESREHDDITQSR